MPRHGARNPDIPASPSRLGTAVTKSAGSSLCCLALERSGRSRLPNSSVRAANFLSEWKLRVFLFFPAVARVQELELQETQ